jgi:hypothetical protein
MLTYNNDINLSASQGGSNPYYYAKYCSKCYIYSSGQGRQGPFSNRAYILFKSKREHFFKMKKYQIMI